jgi:hypothetical protein
VAAGVNGRSENDSPHDDQQHDEILDDLIARADLDGLVRLVERRCTSGDWAGLLRLRSGCRAAGNSGRQL